jgi:hypothetical protein
MAFMDVDGNTKQADGESLYVDDGVLRLDAPDTDEGEQWAALVEYIEPEPPAPFLPTVSTSGDFDTGNWLYANLQGTDVTVASGNSTLVGLSGHTTPTVVNYDATKAYAVIKWGTYQSASGSGRAEFSIIDSGGKIYTKNDSSGSLKLYALRCAVCSDSTATVITVYASSDGTAYNAFKYTINGADYYYVLDEIQTDWTNNLMSIGYSLLPPAPSELTAYFTNQGAAATGDSNPSYGSYTMYDASGQGISTQSGETYALIAKFNKAGTRVPIYPLTPYGGDYLRQFYGALLFETVTAQNVFRVIYNIGLYAYFTSTGATESSNTIIGNSSYYLYDSNGNQISYDSSKTYTIKAIYDIDGNRVLNAGNSYFTSTLGKLKLHGDSETFLTYDAYIIVYEKS